MLCGHETDDLPIHQDIFPNLNNKSSSSIHHSKTERPSTPSESSKSGHSPASRNSADTQGLTMVSGSRDSSPSGHNGSMPMSNGMEEALPHTTSRGTQGEKEDRQSMLEKKYKVEKVKPSSTLSHQPIPSHFKPMFSSMSYRNDDDNVPFPRTCGATFCSNDFLVVFNVPSSVKKITEGTERTPRCLSDLVQKTASPQWMRPQPTTTSMFSIFGSPTPPPPLEGVSISDFFTEKHPKARKYSSHKSSHGRSRDTADVKKDREKEMMERKRRLQKVARIQVYNIGVINPVNLYLAKHYKLDLADKKGCCEHNAKVAHKIGRKDLVQLWTMICHMCQAHLHSSNGGQNAQPWATHPFGRPLAEKYLSLYEKQHDVQTMAMIVCMFWDGVTSPKNTTPARSSTTFPHPDSRLSFETANPYNPYNTYNPYHTVSSMTNLLKGWTTSVFKDADTSSYPSPNPVPNIGVTTTTNNTNGTTIFNTPTAITTTTSYHINNTTTTSVHPRVLNNLYPGSSPQSTTTLVSNSLTLTSSNPNLPAQQQINASTSTTSMLPPLPPPPPPPQPSLRGMNKGKVRALAEVASQPNLSALFKAVMNKGKQARSLSASFDDNFNNLVERGRTESEERLTMDRDLESEKTSNDDNSKMLNPEQRARYEQIKRFYADLLYKWGLLNQRAQLLKHTVSVQGDKKIEFSFPCSNCSDTVLNVQCNRCRYPSLNCSICHVGVRGPANVCLACGHGGHSSHMMKWFHTNSQCPSGCGCNCLQEATL